MKFQVLVSRLSIKSYVFIAAAYKKKKKKNPWGYAYRMLSHNIRKNKY